MRPASSQHADSSRAEARRRRVKHTTSPRRLVGLPGRSVLRKRTTALTVLEVMGGVRIGEACGGAPLSGGKFGEKSPMEREEGCRSPENRFCATATPRNPPIKTVGAGKDRTLRVRDIDARKKDKRDAIEDMPVSVFASRRQGKPVALRLRLAPGWSNFGGPKSRAVGKLQRFQRAGARHAIEMECPAGAPERLHLLLHYQCACVRPLVTNQPKSR